MISVKEEIPKIHSQISKQESKNKELHNKMRADMFSENRKIRNEMNS